MFVVCVNPYFDDIMPVYCVCASVVYKSIVWTRVHLKVYPQKSPTSPQKSPWCIWGRSKDSLSQE